MTKYIFLLSLIIVSFCKADPIIKTTIISHNHEHQQPLLDLQLQNELIFFWKFNIVIKINAQMNGKKVACVIHYYNLTTGKEGLFATKISSGKDAIIEFPDIKLRLELVE